MVRYGICKSLMRVETANMQTADLEIGRSSIVY